MRQLFSGILMLGLLGSAATAEFTLVNDGNPQCNIIIAAEPKPIAWFGAWELQQHILKITGAKVPVLFDNGMAAPGPGEDAGSIQAVSNGVRLLVGESEATRELGLKQEDFKAQEYGIFFKDNAIVFLGNDEYWKDASGVQFHGMSRTWCENIDLSWDRGSMNAVYDFLEKYCGVRWFHPYAAQDDFGTHIPKTNTLEVVAKDIRRKPVFPLRRSPFMVDWFGGNMHDQRMYDLRNKIGGRGFILGHSFYGFTDRFWAKNPERPDIFEEERHDYFAQGYTNGPFDVWISGCPPQPCLTSTGFIAQVVKDAREFFDGKGLKYRSEGHDNMYGLGLNDNNYLCKCENCKALQTGEPHNPGEIFNTNIASKLYWTFVNAVAREVKKTHPDAMIIGYAYFDVAAYPKGMTLEDNVGVSYAYFDRVPSGAPGADLALYREWVGHCKGKIPSVWLYPCFPKETADLQKWNCFWAMHGRHLAKTMRMLADDGVEGIMPCGTAEIVDQYLYAKLYDDPYQDIEALLKDFFSKYFGPAGAPIKKMYDEMETVYYSTNNHPGGRFHTAQEVHWNRLGTNALMTRFDGYMAAAKKLARDDIHKQRLAFWDDKIWKYMVEGKRQFMANLDAWAAENDPGSPKGGLGWADPELDVTDWLPIVLPDRFDMFHQAYSNANGICWFRRTITVPAAVAGKPMVLNLGSIDDSDTVWINGKRVGDTRGTEEPRNYPIPAGILKPGKNLIAIRVYDGGAHGGFKGKKSEMWLRAAGAKTGGLSLAGEWVHKLGTDKDMGWGKL